MTSKASECRQLTSNDVRVSHASEFSKIDAYDIFNDFDFLNNFKFFLWRNPFSTILSNFNECFKTIDVIQRQNGSRTSKIVKWLICMLKCMFYLDLFVIKNEFPFRYIKKYSFKIKMIILIHVDINASFTVLRLLLTLLTSFDNIWLQLNKWIYSKQRLMNGLNRNCMWIGVLRFWSLSLSHYYYFSHF